MTQEDKELLLKDLCARLPYGFIIHRYCDNCDITFNSNEIDDFAHFLEYSEGEIFKPYLRPMSSMTEEEEDEWRGLNIDPLFEAIGKSHTRIGDLILRAKSQYEPVDWLNAHHFDYRNLIEKGLALEASEGMYKGD